VKHLWIPAAQWRRVQSLVPIVCVDVLPVRLKRTRKTIEEVGLILRETPHQGQRWCLIGGRVLFRESLCRAVRRQIQETLGSDVVPIFKPGQQPLYVAEYSPSRGKRFAFDPRQHSVALTYALELKGIPVASGEAITYRWFNVKDLPSQRQFGFDQHRVVKECMRLLLVGGLRT